MKEAISAVYAAVVSLFVVLIYEHLSKQLGWSGLSAVVAAMALGSALLMTYELIVRSRFMARRLCPIYHVQGCWKISLTNHDRPTSICKIRFAHRSYSYSGFGISADGSLGSTWTSRDVHSDEDQDEFSFTSDADLVSGARPQLRLGALLAKCEWKVRLRNGLLRRYGRDAQSKPHDPGQDRRQRIRRDLQVDLRKNQDHGSRSLSRRLPTTRSLSASASSAGAGQ